MGGIPNSSRMGLTERNLSSANMLAPLIVCFLLGACDSHRVSSGKLAQSDLQMGGIPNSCSELVDYSNRSTNRITALLRSAMKEFTSNKQMFTILNSQTKGIVGAINKGKDDNL